MKKYSQYQEESFLVDYFNDAKTGFLVDIGAADGISNSNSRKLIENGWSGLLIEPNKKNYIKLQKLYEKNNLIILENLGCSNTTEDLVDFYIDKNDEYEQLSTFSYSQAEGCKKIFNCNFVKDKIKLQKTSELLSKHNIKEIDFLSIDTESFDTNVILGINFNECNINLICVEHITDEMTEELKKHNYNLCHKTDGNYFFKKVR